MTRFCGGPVDSGGRPCSPLNGEMVVARWLCLLLLVPFLSSSPDVKSGSF